MSPPTRREQVLDLLGVLAVTAGTAAGFAFFGPLGQATISVIGLNLGSQIIQGRCSKLKERWLSSDDGVLNHDIQKALTRALVKALDHIEESYFELPQADALPREGKKYVKRLFRQLKEQAPEEFAACLKQTTQKQAVEGYLYAAPETAADELWQQIAGVIDPLTKNEGFKSFLRENLFVELQFWFGEELKADNKESNKAWRAFQRLLLEGIQAEIEAVRTSQDLTRQDLREIQQDLHKLASLEDRLEQLREVIDRRLPDEPFQQGLEEAVDQLGTRLEEMNQTLQRVDETTRRTDQATQRMEQTLNILVSERHEVGIEDHTAFVNTARPVPENFIQRPEELDKLRQVVIGDQNTGPVALTALQGMGGIGKTALARALCHDEDVQMFFEDAVLEVHIGREPGNLVGQMKQVGQALRDGLGYYDTPEAGADRLRLLLKDKAVLLVLDDVWDARHVEPFLVNAPRCRTLFTTRNADIALRLDAREVQLGELEPEQAVALLREWAKRDDPALPDIAERLGYLPLALRLAGTQLHRERVSGAEWLKTFQRVSQLKLGRYSTDPQENLQVCFDLSVHQLPAEDQQLYYALGIFPEDARIPQSVVARLWRQLSPELSRFDCDELVTELGQLALIERNADDKTVTLHDLLREYAREQLGDESAATHNALLSAYNPDGKPWPQIEHDGYLYHYLAYHLRAAGRGKELYPLLTESSDWMEAKFIACTGDTAYVADLDLAISDFADDHLGAPEVLTLVKLYTVRQSVNARVSGYSDTDLQTLVRLGREAEALAHARLRSTPIQKAKGFLTIYYTMKGRGHPSLSVLGEVQKVAPTISDDRGRELVLASLAVAFAEAERYEEAREVALSTPDGQSRAGMLGTLAKTLTEAGRYEEAREAVLAIPKDWRRAQALAELAVVLAQAGEHDQANGLFGEAREVASTVEDDEQRTGTLRKLADTLIQAGRYEEAREVAFAIPKDWQQARALGSLAKTLTEAGRYEEAREAAFAISEGWWQAHTLALLAVALSEAGEYDQANVLFDQAREAVLAIPEDWRRAQALAGLAAALARVGEHDQANGLFGEAREVASTVEDDEQRTGTLRKLADTLIQAGRYEEAREVALSISENLWRSQTLEKLAETLTGAGRYEEAKEAALAIPEQFDWRQTQTLADLVKTLTGAGRYGEAREAALAIRRGLRRAQALGTLAKTLTEAGRYEEAREAVLAIPEDWWRARGLAELAVVLADAGEHDQANALFDEGRKVASTIEDDEQRAQTLRRLAKTLTKLAESLTGAGRYEEAQGAALAIPEDWEERAQALATLVIGLIKAGEDDQANALFDEAREATPAFPEDWRRPQALASLAVALAQAGEDDQANALFDEAREVASTIEDDEQRSQKLEELAKTLTGAGRYEEARGAALAIPKDWEERAQTLAELAVALAQAGEDDEANALFDEAREAASTIEDDDQRAQTLEDLAKTLTRAGHYEGAREAALAIPEDWRRMHALAGLAAALAEAGEFDQANTLFDEVRGDALAFPEDWQEQAEVLAAVAVVLAQARRYEEVREAALAISEYWQHAQELADLAVGLAQEGEHDQANTLLDEARGAALAIPEDWRRMHALAGLAAALAEAGEFDQANTLFDEARGAVHAIPEDWWRAQALAGLAVSLAQAGERDQANTLFDEARGAALAIPEYRQRAQALAALVVGLAQAGRYEEAREFAVAIPEDWQQARTLENLVQILIEAERYEEAREAALAIQEGRWRARVLTALAAALSQAGRYEEAREAALAIPEDWEQARTLGNLAKWTWYG